MADTSTVLLALPKGRHQLSREQVADAQRLRLAVSMAEAMVGRGYVGTPVATVLKGAGVSRETFYQLYDGKLACFLDALDLAGAVLVSQLSDVIDTPGSPVDRAERGVGRYLASIAEHPAFARLYVIEVHAAGPEALARRAAFQATVVDAMVGLLDLHGAADRFAVQAFVAAIGSLVTEPLARGDLEAVAALEAPLVALLHRLLGEARPT